MRLLKLLASFSLLVSLGCNVPEEPNDLEIGVIDFPRQEIIWGIANSGDPVQRAPLEGYDKATCFKPAEWAKVQAYLDELRDYVKNRCGSK